MVGEQNTCPSGRYWRVQPGDTLYSIARQLETTVEELQRLNPGVDPGNLQVGSSLCLPPEEPLPPCASGVYYRVEPGDTLFAIARQLGTTVDRLLELNPGIDPYNLRIGQYLCLP